MYTDSFAVLRGIMWLENRKSNVCMSLLDSLDENSNHKCPLFSPVYSSKFRSVSSYPLRGVCWLSRGGYVVCPDRVSEGYFHSGVESGHASVFERRPRPEQCYNCQEIGHKAFKCRKPQRCARCAKEGHRHDGCNDQVLKCALCGGPHESFSKHCRKLYPGLHE